MLKGHPGARTAEIGIAAGDKELRTAGRRKGRCRAQNNGTRRIKAKRCGSVHDAHNLQPFRRNNESLARLATPQDGDLDFPADPFVVEEAQKVIDAGRSFPIDRDN